ncbi:MAG TPA: selenocysteine-specific translation elongation factor [Planctomycetales bacterium]|jgi:selenocysteine-specific elongation factor|nr:selenocysteine-specific translation elongation factor [Planctomycetales bacterium]
MVRDLILGTAGHIDHGKTSLVQALTGVDCDRLPEEKARGITIDIGFASLDLPPYHLGVVDVPGHERFIKNMLAGASGVDLALLVVAADDSVMPQTREHLEILRLLGLRHGVIALTKTDLVDVVTREVAELEIRELVRGTFLEDAPIIPTSAHSGAGIPELKAAIADACRRVEERGGEEWFRLAIDRAFIVQGHGTIVTGSVMSGTLHVGDELEWLPRTERVRVRSLQNHDQVVEEVRRGQRAAINLAGVRHEEVLRGQEVATPGYLIPSRVLTVRLHCLADRKRPIKHRLPVRFHLGTSEIMGTVALLDCDIIPPGKWGLAQLFLDEPATATWGQPFVVRESSAAHTLGGGQVLQPVARKIRRGRLETLERVERLWSGDARERALTVAWFSGFAGFTTADLVRGTGIGPDAAAPLTAQLKDEELLAEVVGGGAKRVLLHQDSVKELENRVLTALAVLHAQFPLMTLHDRRKVESQFDYVGDEALVHAAVDRLLARKQVVGDLRRIARADFKPKLNANQRKLKDKLVAAYQEARFQPPEPGSFAGAAGGNAASLKDLFEVCAAEGFLVRVTDDLYLHADADADMRRLVKERLTKQAGGLTVAEIRDLLDTTRKFAVPLCEYLDLVGVTRREGDLRLPACV